MNSRGFDELSWHDAVLREVRVIPGTAAESRCVEVMLDVYADPGSNTREPVTIACSDAVRVTMSASFEDLADNHAAGNVSNLYVKQKVAEDASCIDVLWIYLVDGLIEVSAKSISWSRSA